MRRLVRKYLEIFNRSSFLRSVSVLASGRFISQFISLVTVPVVSRLYTEQDYGEFAIFSSTANIVIAIGAMGLSSAIMAPKELQRSREVFFTAFVIETLVFGVFLIMALVLAPFYHIYDTSIPYIITIVLCYIYMVIYGFSAMLATYVNRLKMNRVLFWNSVVAALSTLLITIPLGYFGMGALGFIIAGIVGSLAAGIQMLVKANPFSGILSVRQMISVCKEFRDYILFQFPANWLNTFAFQLPNQMFSARYGNTALGGYAMSERVLGYPIQLIAAPVATVYFRHATQYVNDGKVNELGRFTYLFVTRILMISFLPLVAFMVFAEKLFGFVLGSNWQTAGLIASILAVQYVLKFCEQCITYCLVVIGKQKVNFMVSVFNLLLIGISLAIGVLIFNNILGAILCYAIGSTIILMLRISIDLYYLGMSISRFILLLFLFVFSAVTLTVGIRYLLNYQLI